MLPYFYLAAMVIGIATPAFAEVERLWDDDPFRTERQIETAGKGLLPNQCPPLPPASHKLSVQESVALSLCNNPATRAQYFSLRAQAASLGTAYGDYMPDISLGAIGASWSKTHQTGASTISKSWGSPSVSMSYTLFNFGKREASIEAAEYTLLAASQSYESGLRDDIASTVQLFYQTATSADAITAAERAEASAQESLHVVLKRIEAGLAAPVDSAQADSNLAAASAATQQARSQRIILQTTLANKLGYPPDALPDTLSLEESGFELPQFQDSIGELIKRAQAQRQDLQAKRHQLSATRATLTASKRSYLPSVSLSTGSAYDDLDVINRDTSRTDSIGVSVSIPLYGGTNQRYAISQAEKQLKATELELEQSERAIALEVSTAYHGFKNSIDQLKAATKALKTSSYARAVAARRYAEGLSTLQELISADASLQSATTSHSKAQSDVLNARVQLLKTLGNLDLTSLNACTQGDATCG